MIGALVLGWKWDGGDGIALWPLLMNRLMSGASVNEGHG